MNKLRESVESCDGLPLGGDISKYLTWTPRFLKICFWLHCVFIAVQRLSLVTVSGAALWLWCLVFSWQCCFCRAQALGGVGIERCGARAELFCDVWNLPGPGVEPMSPALAGGLLTTRPQGKSWTPGLTVVHLPIEVEPTKLLGWMGSRGAMMRVGDEETLWLNSLAVSQGDVKRV